MLREAHAHLHPILQRRDHGFRWRGTEISRIEGLSDAVFAFCVTLLVVSLEAPRRFEELQRMMHGFLSFGICFIALLLIWHTQYIYFRRYALDDLTTFILNAALLFVVAFYVYPLKFLFTVLVNLWTHYQEVDKDGKAIRMMEASDWRSLMIIYNAGFIAVYLIFTLLYRHAASLGEALELSPMEQYETRGVVQENLVMVAIGVLALTLAIFHPLLSGLTYSIIGPSQMLLGKVHARGRKRLNDVQIANRVELEPGRVSTVFGRESRRQTCNELDAPLFGGRPRLRPLVGSRNEYIAYYVDRTETKTLHELR